MNTHAFGIDLGGTTVKMGLFTTDGTLVERWEITTRTEDQGRYLLPDIADSMKEAMTRHQLTTEQIAGVGMGVPGAVLHDSFVKPCVNLEQWGGFDVAAKLEELCGFPAKILNDANAAAMGEMGMGGGKGAENLVFVTLGTGVGGGIIVGGKLLAGVHGAGGEIGHIKTGPRDGKVCGCGKRGCVEQYASATGIVNLAQERLGQGNEETALRGVENLTCKDIFEYAKGGDAVAMELVNELAEHLGRALAAVSCVCDPEVIVIGGGVSKAGTFLLEAVERQFRSYAFPASEDTRFVLAELGNDAGIYGGVQMILQG